MLNPKMTCFNSSDPAAVNATLLFDFYNDNENLWTRSSHGGPLPLCSSPSSPPDSPCWVCLEQKVYAVCHNLTDGVKIMMEAGGVSVDLLKSDCPKPPSDVDGDDGYIYGGKDFTRYQTQNGFFLEDVDRMNCFKSLSPTAVNATVLYDFDDDDHHFWSRRNLTVPLPPCVSSSFSSPPPNSNCLVCHGKKMVFAICRNLTKGVKLTMEAGSDWVNLTATNCPEPSSDGSDDGASKSQLLAIILLLLLLLIGLLLYIFRKELLKFFRAIQGSCSQTPETEKSEQSVVLKNGTP
ncbi:hypothetical protein ABVT39_027168 [Epinephelus coioides]